MQTEIRKLVHYRIGLELSQRELELLRGMLQNPLVEDEDLGDFRVRHAIFHALKEAMDRA